ncbi:type 1 glutamine amidotransferase domain-containing protein [Maribacter hydrothermalis]|uniref:Glutamine amidotransferase n=1 Tax=Maribacter hydrothermalis TaxID=1836467 RepID=A0A1B7YZ93_9FLAO|nr:type 1 glutamine amidotransferase domain-containing protein [Maribacter hydrothermalis]APQ19203.1 type 1 glutamine amidotransferase domain-containing protein [Maribacter hydrothermalis]OBR35789.1 glutamine amidotransferase [Maribacter hydrothermalis]
MFKKYRIVKYVLASLAIVSTISILIGVHIASLLPAEDITLSNSQASEIAYLNKNVPFNRGKILAVVTSTDVMGANGKATGYELTELARAYYVFTANGFDVDIASPLGGIPPVVLDDDDMGIFDYAFLNDVKAQSKIHKTLPLKDVVGEDYKAIYFVGGKGAMYDFPDNTYVQRLVRDFYSANKVIGAVCHGPAALVNVTLKNGKSFLQDRQVSGFTNKEELLLIPKAASIFPFLLQDKLIEQGAVFNEGLMYLEKVSHDENLITGQNPWSVWLLAETMVRQLGYVPKQRTLTGEENAITVLHTYETIGATASKVLIKQIILDKKQTVSRALLIDHGAIAILKADLKKFYDLLGLASYAKDIENK